MDVCFLACSGGPYPPRALGRSVQGFEFWVYAVATRTNDPSRLLRHSIQRLRGEFTINLGTARFETSKVFGAILRLTNQRESGSIGRRVEPLTLKFQDGIMSYERWKIPLGEYPELAAKGLKNTGSENYGGPVVTAGGLVFIAATNYDRKLRAFDKSTGKLLWETTLPFAANATPAVYEAGGRQFVVVCAEGSKGRKEDPKGGQYVAFALPASH